MSVQVRHHDGWRVPPVSLVGLRSFSIIPWGIEYVSCAKNGYAVQCMAPSGGTKTFRFYTLYIYYVYTSAALTWITLAVRVGLHGDPVVRLSATVLYHCAPRRMAMRGPGECSVTVWIPVRPGSAPRTIPKAQGSQFPFLLGRRHITANMELTEISSSGSWAPQVRWVHVEAVFFNGICKITKSKFLIGVLTSLHSEWSPSRRSQNATPRGLTTLTLIALAWYTRVCTEPYPEQARPVQGEGGICPSHMDVVDSLKEYYALGRYAASRRLSSCQSVRQGGANFPTFPVCPMVPSRS